MHYLFFFFYFFFLDQGTSHGNSCRRNFEKSFFDWELEGSVPFLIVESDWRATNIPLTPAICANTSNQNFEITILFNVVQRSENYVFEDDSPQSPHGKGCKICPGAHTERVIL